MSKNKLTGKQLRIIITIFIVVALLLLTMARFMPWWYQKDRYILEGEINDSNIVEYGLFFSQYQLGNQTHYSVYNASYLEGQYDSPYKGMILMFQSLDVLCIISILVLLFCVVSWMYIWKKQISIYILLSVLFASGVLVLALSHYMYFKFSQLEVDYPIFYGNIEIWTNHYLVMGPSIGWFLSIFSAAFLFGTALIIILKCRELGATDSYLSYLKLQARKRARGIKMAITMILIISIILSLYLFLWTPYYQSLDSDGDGYINSEDAFDKDPMEWADTDEDGIGDNIDPFVAPYPGMDIKSFFDINSPGPVISTIGYRLRPLGSMNFADRLYVPGGSDDDPFRPYGVYSYETTNGSRGWDDNPFSTGSQISTEVLVRNCGSDTYAEDADIRIFFGCKDGRIYLLQDNFDDLLSDKHPFGDRVWSYQLDGEVMGISFNGHYYQSGIHKPMLFATTTNGSLYMFQPLGIIEMNDPILQWHVQLSDGPLIAPSLSENREFVYVGSRAGELHGLYTSNGSFIETWDGPYTVTDGDLFTDSVCLGYPGTIYASAQGRLHKIWCQNGTARTGWEGGLVVKDANGNVDGGNLTKPYVTTDGSTILVCSDTGHCYSIDSAGLLIFDFIIPNVNDGLVEILPPQYDSMYSRQTFIVCNFNNGTTDDRSDDYSSLYVLNNRGTMTWKKTFYEPIFAQPIVYSPPRIHLSASDVVVVTVQINSDDEFSSGTIHGFSSLPGRE